MGKRPRVLAGVFFALLLVTAGWWFIPRPAPVLPFEDRAYVWQNAWTPEVRDAVADAASRFDNYLVLVGEVNGLSDSLRFQQASVDWEALSRTGISVTLTLRANRGLLDKRSVSEACAFVEKVLRDRLAAAKNAGVEVEGVQLDYDCPTARLSDYVSLVKVLRKRLGGPVWSITALPTWLESRAFAKLVRQTDYYVLQVHALDTPTTVDAPIVLFDAGKLPARLERALGLRRPYFVALPTYGYQVFFDQGGHFAGLGAENAPAVSPARTVMAMPEEVAKTVAVLRKQPPAWCRGIAWFRLPVATDTLNWSWKTLESVMEGKAPSTLPEVELRRPEKNLLEIWLTNTTGYVGDRPVSLSIRWKEVQVVASDALGGFEASMDSAGGQVTLVGPAPRGSKPVMAAWLRLDDETLGVLRVEKVEWAR